MKFFNQKNNRGFTLVEIMVSTSIFMMIMLVALGTLVTSSDAAKKAQALRNAMDSVNFAMESMTRSLRTGSDYSCLVANFNSSVPAPTNYDCPINSTKIGWGINFRPANIPAGSNPPGTRNISYIQATRYLNGQTGVEAQRCDSVTGNCLSLVSKDVDVQMLRFYVNGSDTTDKIQPSVYIIMKGVVSIKGVDTPFAVQTMVSQRSSE